MEIPQGAPIYPNSFPLQNHRQSHKNQHSSLEPRVLAQQNSHIPDARHVPYHAPHDIPRALEKLLSAGVEFRVVGSVVVAFCQ